MRRVLLHPHRIAPIDKLAVGVLGPGINRLQTVELGVSKAALALPRLANER